MSERFKTLIARQCGLVIADMTDNQRPSSAKRYVGEEITDLLNSQNNRIKELEEKIQLFQQTSNLCEHCSNLLHYNYDREVSLSCLKGYEPRLYPPITDCNGFELEHDV